MAEIIFTSGATADPKGVIITHRNILANIIPIEREMAKYKKYARPFLPIRFLNLLPLSHMFGQAMATFVPTHAPWCGRIHAQLRSGGHRPQIRTRRISVLVCVPKMLEVLKEHVLRTAPEAADAPVKMHWTKRWWKYRRIHRMFGFKFWAMVVGAAPLDPDLETFWGRLRIPRGPGLRADRDGAYRHAEPSDAFGARGGGETDPGVEVRIADDGEILVRGENVAAQRLLQCPGADARGIRGRLVSYRRHRRNGCNRSAPYPRRKKEMIVTPEGLNVFPEDVERVLNEVAGVTESAGGRRVAAGLNRRAGAGGDCGGAGYQSR